MTPLDFQKPALDEIVARARAYYRGDWRELPIRPRWATILVAPTGLGKTTTATMVAGAAGVSASVCRVSAPAYMPSGAHNRSTKETIGVIAQHVAKHDRTVLFLDELDKINDEKNSWQGYIRGELFDLIGGDWPTGLTPPELDTGPDPTIEQLTEKLRTSVFFLAAGTFQQWFDESPCRRTMGFMADEQEREELTADIIAQSLPRELINRFGKIVRLPELRESDYRQIATEAEKKLPEHIRELFRAEVIARIPEAIAAKKGVRFIEEAVTAVLINLPEPTPQKPKPITIE